MPFPRRSESSPGPSGRASLDVLVADDDPTVRQLMGRVLRRRGHRVHEARDADGALKVARSTALDVALVDDRMPGGGRSVITALAEEGFTGVVAFMGGALGADGRPVPEGVQLLRKPFDLDRLIAVVEGGEEGEPA